MADGQFSLEDQVVVRSEATIERVQPSGKMRVKVHGVTGDEATAITQVVVDTFEAFKKGEELVRAYEAELATAAAQ